MADIIPRPDSTYPIVARPYKLDISQFGERVRDRMKFTINNVSEQDINLTMIAGLPGFAEIDLPKVVEAGKSASGEVILMPGSLDKEFEKSFTFECNDEAKSRFTIPVKRAIRAPGDSSEGAAAGEAKEH